MNFIYSRNFSLAIIIILLLSAATLVFYWRSIDHSMSFGDSTYLIQIIENLQENGEAKSDVQDAINEVLFSDVLQCPPEQLCSSDLGEKLRSSNLMPYHPYFILYIISPFVSFFSTETIILFFTIGGFFFLLFLLSLYMDTNGLSIELNILFLVLASLFPAWSLALQGQYYTERLFVLPMAFLLWALHQKKIFLLQVCIAIAVCALITERTGIITGLYVAGFGVLHYNLTPRKRIVLICLGLVCTGYSLALIHFYVDNPYYNSSSFLPHSVGELVSRFRDPAFTSKFWIFIYFCTPLLLLGLGDWRALLLAVGVMLPNMVGTVGGAEKTGFSSHYHTLYMPVLIWAAGSGLVNITKSFPQKMTRKILTPVLALLIAVLVMADATDGSSLGFGKFSASTSVLYIAARGVLSDTSLFGCSILKDQKRNEIIRSIVPEGVRVTTTEVGMYILQHKRTMYYYPLGTGVADYALLPYQKNDFEGYQYSGAASYLGPEEKKKLDRCLNKRLRSAGYEVDNPIWTGYGLAVIKRGRSKGGKL